MKKSDLEPKSVMQLLVDNGIDIKDLDREQLKSFLTRKNTTKDKQFIAKLDKLRQKKRNLKAEKKSEYKNPREDLVPKRTPKTKTVYLTFKGIDFENKNKEIVRCCDGKYLTEKEFGSDYDKKNKKIAEN